MYGTVASDGRILILTAARRPEKNACLMGCIMRIFKALSVITYVYELLAIFRRKVEKKALVGVRCGPTSLVRVRY